MLRALKRHWFLFCLAFLLAVGVGGHIRLKPLADLMPQAYVVASVLLVMSLG